jgi:tetratricopeptide (TPR) repeat protein
LDCYEQMLAILDRALEQNRRNAVLLRIKGRILCEVGDFESAADLLKQATERNPEDRDNFHLLGWALENLGRERAEDAKQAYEAALARNPPPLAELWSRKGLADALRLAGDMSGARKQYSEVLQEVERHEEPADPDILWFLGWCHYQLENYDEAARLYVDALSLSSDMSEMIPTQFDLGLALLCGKRYDPGLQEYQWGLQLTSKRSPMRQRGLLRVALIDFAQAMEKSPALRNQTEVFKVEAALNDAYNKALQSLAPQPTPAASTVS